MAGCWGGCKVSVAVLNGHLLSWPASCYLRKLEEKSILISPLLLMVKVKTSLPCLSKEVDVSEWRSEFFTDMQRFSCVCATIRCVEVALGVHHVMPQDLISYRV